MSRNRKPSSKNRTFRLESLERREMMSATPWPTAAGGSDERQPVAVAPMTAAPQASAPQLQALSAVDVASTVVSRPFVANVQGGVLKIQMTQAGLWLYGRPDYQRNELVIQASLMNNSMAYVGEPLRVPLSGITKIEYVGTNGDDKFDIRSLAIPSIAYGLNGIDTLDGGSARDVFYGGDGNDWLYGNDGTDELYGDNGLDKLFGGDKNDVLHGGAHNDDLYGHGGADVLFGDEGADLFNGSEGIDRIYFAKVQGDRINNLENHDVVVPIDPSTTSLALYPYGSVSKMEGPTGVTTTFIFRVTRTGDTNKETTFNYAVTGIGPNGASRADFVGGRFPAGPLTFAKGETTKDIVINVAGDAVLEPTELFAVTLSNASGSAIITTRTAIGTIRNRR